MVKDIGKWLKYFLIVREISSSINEIFKYGLNVTLISYGSGHQGVAVLSHGFAINW